MQKIIGLVGFIGSGKNTAADIICRELSYQQLSFSSPVKDAVSSIFGWDRKMLEGDTRESRILREQKDVWWSEHLGFDIAPRNALQLVGTELFRNEFHNDIWILSAMRKINEKPETNFVFSDVRFINEIAAIEKIGGKLIRIKRGDDPDWFTDAKKDISIMRSKYKSVHESEWNWIQASSYVTIENNGSLDDLKTNLLNEIKD